MGRLLLVVPPCCADLRRRPAEAALLLLAITAATATLTLGPVPARGDRQRCTSRPGRPPPGRTWWRSPATRARAVTSALAVAGERIPRSSPTTAPTASSTPTSPRAVPRSSAVVVHGFAETPGAVNRPLVTSGRWVRPGGTVLERGFATALGVGVGDHVTIAGRSYPVVGIAVTAATSIYPWAAQIGPYGGPSDYSGLAWMTRSDARALASSRDLPVTMALDLKLRDPAATEAFRDAHRDSTVRINFHSWQFTAAAGHASSSGTASRSWSSAAGCSASWPSPESPRWPPDAPSSRRAGPGCSRPSAPPRA